MRYYSRYLMQLYKQRREINKLIHQEVKRLEQIEGEKEQRRVFVMKNTVRKDRWRLE